MQLLFLFIFAAWFMRDAASQTCVPKDFGQSSFVCVCNATYCNFDGPSTPLQQGQMRLIRNSISQYRNFEEIVNRQDNENITSADADFSIYVDSTLLFQSIIGYGGAFTDSASINIKTLSDAAQDVLLRMYFGAEGSRYNLVRVPIAGSDFSTHPYSYDDVVGDVDLAFWNLTEEDYLYKLPAMRKALGIVEDELYILGSPWSPPSWMKTNGMFNESGELLKEMWQPYANYLVKFFQAYETELNTQLWGFTPQNEPLGGFDPDWAFNTCGWTAEDMRDWIAQDLGPTVEAAGFRRLKLLIDDFNRTTLPWYPMPSLVNNGSSKYVDGVAVHWYDDFIVGPESLDDTHDLAPDKFILYTEACEGDRSPEHVILGSWERGERYIMDIIENSNHWSSGWIDWNLALDMQGGPNWVDNFVDSPIIINAANDEFYVQPMYYAINQFSRNVARGANRIFCTVTNDYDDNLRAAAFLNPDGTVALIVANVAPTDFSFSLATESGNYIFTTMVPARSWITVTYYA